jgi:hypothetical protein
MRGLAATSVWIAGITALLIAGGPAAAGDAGDLYRGRTLVTGQTEATRAPALARCLTDVLIKVSGDPRLSVDPKAVDLARDAAKYVREFRYRDLMADLPVHDEQGTRDRPYELTAWFHPATIDATLRALGREPWTAARPRVAVLLHVRHGARTYRLSSDGDHGPGMREALADAAGRAGLVVALPNEAALTKAGSSLQAPQWSPSDLAGLDAIAKTAGGDVALAGSLVWSDTALGWIATWRLPWQGRTYRWQIKGVNFDEAFRAGMRGAAQILSGNGQPG